jgi:hypothetical protein
MHLEAAIVSVWQFSGVVISPEMSEAFQSF